MRKNEYLENELKALKETGKSEASWDVLRGYEESVKTGNELLNLHTINIDCREIVETLNVAGIKSFTVSDNSTAGMLNLYILTKEGAKPAGMTTTHAPWSNIDGYWETIPAALFEL